MEQRTIQTQESAERIDALLARSLPELTRSAAQRLLAQGAVTKDGAPVKKNYKTVPGDTFVVTMPDAAPSALVAQDLPLDVVYEDDDLIVVNKPRGMVVHPAPGHEDGTLVNALLAHCGESLSGVGGERRPGIVHRIDKDTSGLLVAAKNDFAHLALSAQLADHTMARTYEVPARAGAAIHPPAHRQARDVHVPAAGLFSGRAGAPRPAGRLIRKEHSHAQIRSGDHRFSGAHHRHARVRRLPPRPA